ncbi:MAG TPA: DUF4249 family protein [Hanamia sp.]
MRSYKIIYLLASMLLTFSFWGCKKVIDVDLKNAATQLVITGEVNNRPGPYHVNISQSVNFSSDNTFPPVSGAFVTITGNGLVDTLTEKTPGDYTTRLFTGVPGFTYQLYVETGGHVYTATSTMPQPVHLDSITFVEGGLSNDIYPVVNFQDPAGVANFYKFKESVKGEAFPDGRGNAVFDDQFSDGRYINLTLYSTDSSDIKSGMKLTVEMNCVDENVYNYLNGLLQISSPGSPSPGNPPSNISGGALGYFSANTKTARVVDVP